MLFKYFVTLINDTLIIPDPPFVAISFARFPLRSVGSVEEQNAKHDWRNHEGHVPGQPAGQVRPGYFDLFPIVAISDFSSRTASRNSRAQLVQ